MGGGCHGGQVHSAHYGLVTYYNVPRLYQSLYTGGGGSGPCSFEASRRIAMEGKSYQRDRYGVVDVSNLGW